MGSADEKLMPFSYRSCLTQEADNALPFPQPPGYSAEDFEIVRRYVASFNQSKHPNGEAHMGRGELWTGERHRLSCPCCAPSDRTALSLPNPHCPPPTPQAPPWATSLACTPMAGQCPTPRVGAGA